MRFIPKPGTSEYPAYSGAYIDLIPDDGMVLQHMWNNYLAVKELIYLIPEEKLYYRYDPGKWTIKEILVHIIDDERIFACRALRFARNDKTELPGFEQDEYTIYSKANERSLESIFTEYENVRKSTIDLFEFFPDDCFLRSGTTIGNINLRTVRALAYHIAGHEQRHMKVIKERYLPEIPFIDDVFTY